MKRTINAIAALLVLIFLATQATYAQPRAATQEPAGVHAVATSEIAAELAARDAQERITGRISFHLVVTPEDMEQGRATVRGFNVAFFGVSQELLAGKAPIHAPLGLLGFSNSPGEVQALRYDAENGQIAGELQMYADASFLNAFAQPARDGEKDLFETPVVPTTAAIRMGLEAPLKMAGEPQRVPAKLELELRTKETRYRQFVFPALAVSLLEPIDVIVDVGPIQWLEVKQRLCVQPVRITRLQVLYSRFGFPQFFLQSTGAGLAFGEPGARAQWDKADVVFQIRDWKSLFTSAYWELDSTEDDDLRALVDDDDCIEVFFVYDLIPEDMWGGGATWGSGTASSKIISSDGNARGGVDFTHLAHELGHSLGLRHPGASATASAEPASSGTLMCPSGYLNDNPQVNSQENEDLLSNPLLTFTLGPIGAGPDCLNSADCGPCP